MSVNVSARQFRTPGFVDQVRGALRRAGLPPAALMLEITESLLLRDDEQVWADLAALREIGVRIAIDDFGTGYSSLGYLRRCPVDMLKIDKSFIDDDGDVATSSAALVDGDRQAGRTRSTSRWSPRASRPRAARCCCRPGLPVRPGLPLRRTR